MKLFDKLNDLLDRPMPTAKEIKKELKNKNIGIQIRTDKQYSKESIYNMHEGARLVMSQMYYVMKYAGLVVCTEGKEAYWNARQFCYYYKAIVKLLDDCLHDNEALYGNEIKTDLYGIPVVCNTGYFILGEINDLAENIIIDYEEKQEELENEKNK